MSNFVVSARKYRPKHFSEVVGQEHIVATLESALEADQLPHAFLFCGPRGVGKTTCARILARALNCQNPVNVTDPCGECDACKAFERNASFNIFELDAASYNGVDNIRLLNEQVRVPPSEGKYKVYIIDEVHMLSTGAFNAFLKTLEEPPPYAIFILATTEKHKILPTILSRCQIFDFRRIQVKDMATHLKSIAETEGITADYDALITIAEKADGALRDALSLFDRISNVAHKSITYKTVVENLNLLDYDVFFKTSDACLREDIRQVLTIFDEVMRNGFEGNIFLDGLAEHYRDLLVCKNPETLHLQDHSDSLKERYQNQAQLMPAPYIFSALNIINESDITYPQVRNKRLHVEMALAKICFMNRQTTGSPFAPEKKTAEQNISTGNGQSVAPDTSKPKDQAIHKPKSAPVVVSASANPTPVVPKPETSAKPVRSEQPGEPKPKFTKPVTPAAVPGANEPFRKAKSLIPQVKSLDQLANEIKQNEKLLKENSRELTDHNLKKWWHEIQEQSNSPSVTTALKLTSISLNEKLVTIEAASQVSKTRVQEMNSLLSDLRTEFNDSKLQLTVVLNIPEDQENEQKPKRHLTNKEKYELLSSKNPNVEDLRTSLDLVVDHDE